MEEILVAVLQFLFELVLNVGTYAPLDGVPSRNRFSPEGESAFGYGAAWLVVGVVVGGLSLLIFKYTLLKFGYARIALLFVSPVASGYLGAFIAERRARSNPFIEPRIHFWSGFWFSFGVAAVRFAYAARA